MAARWGAREGMAGHSPLLHFLCCSALSADEDPGPLECASHEGVVSGRGAEMLLEKTKQ